MALARLTLAEIADSLRLLAADRDPLLAGRPLDPPTLAERLLDLADRLAALAGADPGSSGACTCETYGYCLVCR